MSALARIHARASDEHLFSGFIHDANTNAENMKRALQELANSIDNLCEEYLESGVF